MNLKDILEAINGLPEAEKAEAQAALTPAAEATDTQSDGAGMEVAAEVEEDKAEAAVDEPPDSIETAADSQEQIDAVEANTEADETVDAVAEESAEGGIQPRTQTDEDVPVAVGDPIPAMTRGETAPDLESMPEELAEPPAQATASIMQDEQGGDLPIDYQSIVDGLNAKTLALEAENKQLKAKMEGAFGLASKPGGFVPSNPLYNDTSDIPRMRK